MPVETLAGSPLWMQIVSMVAISLVTLFVLPWLKRKAEMAKAETLRADLGSRELLLGQIKLMLLEEATSIAEEKFPKLVKIIAAKNLKPVAIKEELKLWGQDLKTRAIEYFKVQGVDLVGAIGDSYLDRLIRGAADATSPFPGKETAVALLEKEWSNKLVKYGVEWVKERYMDGGDAEDA